MKKVTVVNLVSFSYTGTTWINVMLGCHRDAFAMGPPDRFFEFYKKPEELCLVHRAECKFWPAFCKVYDPGRNFFLQLAEFSGKSFFVINNPVPAGFGKELTHPDVGVKEILVVRDGRVVTASYARKFNVSFPEAIRTWYYPASISFNLDRFKDALKLRYEDVARDPAAALKRAGEYLGLDFPKNAVRFWEFEQHLITGNLGMISLIRHHLGLSVQDFEGRVFYEQQYRRLTGGGERFEDERWKNQVVRADLYAFDFACGEFNEKQGYPRDVFTKKEARAWGRGLRKTLGMPDPVKRTVWWGRSLAARTFSLFRGAAGKLFRLVTGRRAFDLEEKISLFKQAVEHCRGIEARPGFGQSVEHWRHSDERVRSHFWIYAAGLRKVFKRYRGSTGLDFGCWSGFSSYILLLLGAKKVTGVDVVEVLVEDARSWSRQLGVEGLSFEHQPLKGRLPLENESVDWAVLAQVYSAVNTNCLPHVLDEIARVVRPGGLVFLNDSNNPRSAEARERLLKHYRGLELGDGTPEAPNGKMFNERLNFIAESHPGMAEEERRELARRTCYLWKDEILRVIELYKSGGTYPFSFFQEGALRAVIHPVSGNAMTNPTDPLEIAAEFERRGFRVRLSASPGGPALKGKTLTDTLAAQPGFYLYAWKKRGKQRPGYYRDYRVTRDSRSVKEVFDDRHEQIYWNYGPDYTASAKLKKAPSAPFSDYENFIDRLAGLSGVRFATMRELHFEGEAAPGRVCLKHDMDGDPEESLWMARLEAKNGIRSTYYVLHTAPYYGSFVKGRFRRYEKMAAVYREIQELGHEVGLHADPYSLYLRRDIDGAQAVRTELEWLRSRGLDIRGVFGHSSASINGVESVEIFREHLDFRSELFYAPERALLHADFTKNGKWGKRLVLSLRELGLDYCGEFIVRTSRPYSYWSVMSQERCRATVNAAAFPAGAPARPKRDISVPHMLEIIGKDLRHPFVWHMLNIHPLTFGGRVGPRRGREREGLREAHRNYQSLLAEEAHYRRGKLYAHTVEAGGRKNTGFAFANEYGMLDFPAPAEKTQPSVLVLGDSVIDSAHVCLAGQFVRRAPEEIRAESGREVWLRKFAFPGASARHYEHYYRACAKEKPPFLALVCVGPEFLDGLPLGPMEARLLEWLTHFCLLLAKDQVKAVILLQDFARGSGGPITAEFGGMARSLGRALAENGAGNALEVVKLSSWLSPRGERTGAEWLDAWDHELMGTGLAALIKKYFPEYGPRQAPQPAGRPAAMAEIGS